MTPVKPFETYKWRWLSVAPTESLLVAPVFLGVLRALARFENHSPSDPALMAALGVVQQETRSPVNLVRTPDRNLIRNSGQYWKGTGLLEAGSREIQLTTLGRRVADGRITQGEFAALMVQQTVLPNSATYSPAEFAKWRAARLEIRPLKLILEVIEELGRRHGGLPSAFLTNEELMRIVIPLAGVKEPAAEIARQLALYRRGRLDISNWPDCAPMDNDPRLAREFLLFLANFGLLQLDLTGQRDQQPFRMAELFDVDAVTAPIAGSIFTGDESAARAVEEVRHSDLPSIIERQRVLTTVTARPGQARFRAQVMSAYAGRCFLTGEEISEVLEAAHIIPVKHGGDDEQHNGLCLRIDIHRLFDSGNLRIRPDGVLAFSETVAASPNYSLLPRSVTFPPFINPANIAWRDNYL